MSDVPYYLSPTVPALPQDGSIDLFNFDTLRGSNVYETKNVDSVWDSLSEIPTKAGTWVYDSTTGVFSAVTGFAADAADSVKQNISSLLDSIRSNLLLVVAIGLGIIWVVARSGILTQVSGFIK